MRRKMGDRTYGLLRFHFVSLFTYPHTLFVVYSHFSSYLALDLDWTQDAAFPGLDQFPRIGPIP